MTTRGFLEAARVVLERDGLSVVGVAMTSAEAVERMEELRPDVGRDGQNAPSRPRCRVAPFLSRPRSVHYAT